MTGCQHREARRRTIYRGPLGLVDLATHFRCGHARADNTITLGKAGDRCKRCRNAWRRRYWAAVEGPIRLAERRKP